MCPLVFCIEKKETNYKGKETYYEKVHLLHTGVILNIN